MAEFREKRRRGMIGLIVTGFYVAGIVAALHAVLTARTPTGSVAWAVSLVTMPFIAVPAYAVLGRDQFEGMSEAFEQRQDEIESVVRKFEANLEPLRVAYNDAPSWQRAIHKLSELHFLEGNDLELLVNGEATFASILEGIASAEHYILFQFYMIHDDGLGRRVQQALMARAREGVQVRVLYDEVGSSGLPAAYVEALEAAGAEVSAFKPTQGWRNRFQLNFRNHRKMVVVDGKARTAQRLALHQGLRLELDGCTAEIRVEILQQERPAFQGSAQFAPLDSRKRGLEKQVGGQAFPGIDAIGRIERDVRQRNVHRKARRRARGFAVANAGIDLSAFQPRDL